MTAVYVFAAVVALLLLGLIVGAVYEPEPTDPDEAETAAGRREAALEALRELEFEYRTGKLEEEDYRQLRERYAARAGEPGERLCPECGEPAGPEALYCGSCGSRLPPAVGESGPREPGEREEEDR